MVKKKISNEKNPKKEIDKKVSPIEISYGKEFFTVLSLLITFYFAILGGIYTTVLKLNESTQSISTENLLVSIPGIILIGIGVIFFLYFLFVLFVGVIELNFYSRNVSERAKKIRDSLRKQVLNSPILIITNLFSLACFSLISLFVYFRPVIATIFSIILLFMIVFTSLLLKGNFSFLKDLISFIVIKEPTKVSFLKRVYIFFFCVSILLLMIILFSAFLFHSAHFEINLDKETYFLGEDIYVTIFPKGIIKPIPLNIIYSNKEISLNYTKHEKFNLAPIYLKIPSEVLTSEPYNSYLKIEYKINQLSFLYPKKMSYDLFIPVFNETSKE